jgi:hypothetical protein
MRAHGGSIAAMRARALPWLLLVGCASAPMQSLKIVNRTDRPVEEIYVYPLGAPDHGASRGALAASATTTVAVPAGHFEITAVSAKVQIDEHTRERRTGSSALEVTAKRVPEVVLYDTANRPAELTGEGVVGVEFKSNP